MKFPGGNNDISLCTIFIILIWPGAVQLMHGYIIMSCLVAHEIMQADRRKVFGKHISAACIETSVQQYNQLILLCAAACIIMQAGHRKVFEDTYLLPRVYTRIF